MFGNFTGHPTLHFLRNGWIMCQCTLYDRFSETHTAEVVTCAGLAVKAIN